MDSTPRPPAHPPPVSSSSSSSHSRVVSSKTLWMGAIQPHWDETYLSALFSSFRPVMNVKIIRSIPSSAPVGYAFIEFGSVEAARAVLEHFHGLLIPGTSVKFRLNWRTKSTSNNADDKPRGGGPRAAEVPSLFVGDLSSEVTSELLFSEFSARFKSCLSAKVIRDQATERSKGYGFVDFRDYNDFHQALHSMKGVTIGSKPIRTGTGKPKSQGRFSYNAAAASQYIRNTKNPYDTHAFPGTPYDYHGAAKVYNPPLPYVPRPYIQYHPVHVQQPWQQGFMQQGSQFPLAGQHAQGHASGMAFPHGSLYPVTPVPPHQPHPLQAHQQQLHPPQHMLHNSHQPHQPHTQQQLPQQLQQQHTYQQANGQAQPEGGASRTEASMGISSNTGQGSSSSRNVVGVGMGVGVGAGGQGAGMLERRRRESEDIGRPSDLTPEQPLNESPESLEAEEEQQEDRLGTQYSVDTANRNYMHRKNKAGHHTTGLYHSATKNALAIDADKIDNDSKTE